jgi:hypothetical protein
MYNHDPSNTKDWLFPELTLLHSSLRSQDTYYSVYKMLSLLTFLFIFDYSSYLKIKKNIIYFTIIYFINKENSNTTYNFTYLNTYFE